MPLIAHPSDELSGAELIAVVSGPALYLLAHVALLRAVLVAVIAGDQGVAFAGHHRLRGAPHGRQHRDDHRS